MATPASSAVTNSVFGHGNASVGAGEFDAITRALADLVVPLTEAWTAVLGGEVTIEIGEVGAGPVPRPSDAEPVPGASMLDGITGEGAYLALADLDAELGTVALAIPTALGLVVVDLLLGGSGRPTGDRSLSAIDLDLLATVAPPTFGCLRHIGPPERLEQPVELVTEIEEVEIEARLGGGATVAVTVTVGEHVHPFTLLFGAGAARFLAGTTGPTATESLPGQSRHLLERVLSDVVVEAVVAFPPVLVPSHRIIGLDIGDVIGLGTHPDDPLPLRVDGRRIADVLPARAGGDVACQVVSTAIDPSTFHADDPFSAHAASLASGGTL